MSMRVCRSQGSSTDTLNLGAVVDLNMHNPEQPQLLGRTLDRTGMNGDGIITSVEDSAYVVALTGMDLADVESRKSVYTNNEVKVFDPFWEVRSMLAKRWGLPFHCFNREFGTSPHRACV